MSSRKKTIEEINPRPKVEPVGEENGLYRFEGKVVLPSGKHWSTGATGMHGARHGLIMQIKKIIEAVEDNGGDDQSLKLALRDFQNCGIGPILETGGRRDIDLENGKQVILALVPCRLPIEEAKTLPSFPEPSWLSIGRMQRPSDTPAAMPAPAPRPSKPRDKIVEGVNVSEVARQMGKAARKSVEGEDKS